MEMLLVGSIFNMTLVLGSELDVNLSRLQLWKELYSTKSHISRGLNDGIYLRT